MKLRLFFITTLAAVLSLQYARAQFETGKFFMDGSSNLGFTSSTSHYQSYGSGGSTSTFNAALRLGTFVVKGLGIGPDLSFTSLNSGNTTEGVFSVGAFVRYYTPPKLFFDLGAALDRVNSGSNADGSTIRIAFGYAAMLNDRIALEPMFSYSAIHLAQSGSYYNPITGNYSSTASVDTDVIGINIGFTFFFGTAAQKATAKPPATPAAH